MRAKIFTTILLSLLLSVGFCACSDSDDNPDDYTSSILTGEYQKDGLWTLSVSVNGEAIDNYGYVRFESKNLETANFKFVDVIPGLGEATFSNIPLTQTDSGITFSISDNVSGNPITIEGTVIFGNMTINITK